MKTLVFISFMIMGLVVFGQSSKDITKEEIFRFVNYLEHEPKIKFEDGCSYVFKEFKDMKFSGIYLSESDHKTFLIKTDTLYKQKYISVVFYKELILIKTDFIHPDLPKMDDVELTAVQIIFLLEE